VLQISDYSLNETCQYKNSERRTMQASERLGQLCIILRQSADVCRLRVTALHPPALRPARGARLYEPAQTIKDLAYAGLTLGRDWRHRDGLCGPYFQWNIVNARCI